MAGGVSGSEVFGAIFDEVTGGVGTDVGSLRGSLRGGGVAGGVGIAATAFGRSADAAGDCFDVEGGVCSAVWLGVITAATAFGVDTAYSLGVVIAATAGTASDAGSAISLRGGVGGGSIAFGDRFSCCCWSNF